jgi:hypothetical protein
MTALQFVLGSLTATLNTGFGAEPGWRLSMVNNRTRRSTTLRPRRRNGGRRTSVKDWAKLIAATTALTAASTTLIDVLVHVMQNYTA